MKAFTSLSLLLLIPTLALASPAPQQDANDPAAAAATPASSSSDPAGAAAVATPPAEPDLSDPNTSTSTSTTDPNAVATDPPTAPNPAPAAHRTGSPEHVITPDESSAIDTLLAGLGRSPNDTSSTSNATTIMEITIDADGTKHLTAITLDMTDMGMGLYDRPRHHHWNGTGTGAAGGGGMYEQPEGAADTTGRHHRGRLGTGTAPAVADPTGSGGADPGMRKKRSFW